MTRWFDPEGPRERQLCLAAIFYLAQHEEWAGLIRMSTSSTKPLIRGRLRRAVHHAVQIEAATPEAQGRRGDFVNESVAVRVLLALLADPGAFHDLLGIARVLGVEGIWSVLMTTLPAQVLQLSTPFANGGANLRRSAFLRP